MRTHEQEERAAAMRKMYDAGSTLEQVGAAYGVSRQRVSQVIGAGRPWSSGGPRPIRHGNRYAYMKRGCRCESCREAESSYRRSRRLALANNTGPELGSGPMRSHSEEYQA